MANIPCREWKASTAAAWIRLPHKSPHLFSSHLNEMIQPAQDTRLPKSDVFGAYILISALLQSLYFRKQLSPDKVDLSQEKAALQRWLADYEHETQTDNFAPQPLAFNATALLRLAYVRLYCNFGRALSFLSSCDPHQVAEEILSMPAVERTAEICRAADHARRGLNILVRIGPRLCSQTQAFVWSLQHSLCSFEAGMCPSRHSENAAHRW